MRRKIRAWWRYVVVPFFSRKGDQLLMWIAWRLPDRLVMWCYVRVGAYATTGENRWEGNVPDLPMMEALRRWPVT